MILKVSIGSILLSLMIVLSGCQSQGAAPAGIPGQTPAIPPTGQQTITPAALPGLPIEVTLEPEVDRLVSLAREKLAQKYDLNTRDLILFSVEPATWPDSSLGCPQPGALYQQVVTPGYQMVFEAGGKAYVVHADQGEVVMICSASGPNEIYPTP